MKIKRFIQTGILFFLVMFVLVSYDQGNTGPILKKDHPNILRGVSIEMLKGRRGYNLGGRIIMTKHFALRVTRPENPFKSHKHEQSELWFVIDGQGVVTLDGVDYKIGTNDLIMLDPWIEHGLSTTSEITWICLG